MSVVPGDTLPDARRGRVVFFAAFAVALAIYIAAGVLLPDAWEAALAVPWALVSVLALDHLHGHGEFTRAGPLERLFPMILCVALAAGQVQDPFDGLAGWLASGLAFVGLLVAVELLARRLRPRYRGGGILA